MQHHYNFSDEVYAKLLKEGVTVKHLFQSIVLFDPHHSGAELGNATSLLYYLDEKKTIETGKDFPHRKIARAIFDSLSVREKISIAEYEELVENNYAE